MTLSRPRVIFTYDGDGAFMRIKIDPEGDGVLAGKLRGEAAWEGYRSRMHEAARGSLVEFDFSAVRLMTGSYMTAGILPAWQLAGALGLFPVLTMVADRLQDDVAMALRDLKLTAWVTAGRLPTGVHLLGAELDPVLLDIVDKTATRLVSAVDLHETSNDTVGRTAWSNRLALLEEYRILRSMKTGRKLCYTRPWNEVAHG